MADAMCLIPMKLGKAHAAMLQSHVGNAFQLPPSSRPELASQPHDIVDVATNGNDLDIAYLPDDLKVHGLLSH